MRGIHLLMVVGWMAGCGCGQTQIHGETDAIYEDTIEPLPDVRPDPMWDSIMDTPYDFGAEEIRDEFLDVDSEPECISLTAPVGGECNIAEQCGCATGVVCGFQLLLSTCRYTELCGARYGTLPVEAECRYFYDCLPGTNCIVGYGATMGRCREWCTDSSDCSITGRSCNGEVTLVYPRICDPAGPEPYLICSMECPPSAECDLFATGSDPTGCPDGQTCVRDLPISAGGCDINMCVPEGTGVEDDECRDSENGCRRSMGCYRFNPYNFYCRSYCDTSHACRTGTCVLLGSESWPELGTCTP